MPFRVLATAPAFLTERLQCYHLTAEYFQQDWRRLRGRSNRKEDGYVLMHHCCAPTVGSTKYPVPSIQYAMQIWFHSPHIYSSLWMPCSIKLSTYTCLVFPDQKKQAWKPKRNIDLADHFEIAESSPPKTQPMEGTTFADRIASSAQRLHVRFSFFPQQNPHRKRQGVDETSPRSLSSQTAMFVDSWYLSSMLAR